MTTESTLIIALEEARGEVRRLKEHIGELKDLVECRDLALLGTTDYYNPDTHTTISFSKIDAAWEERHDGVVEGIMYIPASEIGITECENPRCQDGRHIETTHLPSRKCAACNGHGWKIGTDDE